MRTILLTIAGLLAASPVLASDQSDVLAVVKKFDDGFNNGDVKSAVATCAPNATIIDDFPPHVWRTANTCQDWADQLDAYDKKSGIVAGPVTYGKPWHAEVTGDHAYVVLPVTYKYTLNGKAVNETGSVWTLVLQKFPKGWLITAWSWGQH